MDSLTVVLDGTYLGKVHNVTILTYLTSLPRKDRILRVGVSYTNLRMECTILKIVMKHSTPSVI